MDLATCYSDSSAAEGYHSRRSNVSQAGSEKRGGMMLLKAWGIPTFVGTYDGEEDGWSSMNPLCSLEDK